MGRTCAKCSAEIPPQKGSSRPRKFCTACRPPRKLPNPRIVKLQQSDGGPKTLENGLVGEYRRRLDAAGRLDSPEGAHVLLLARMFEAGGHTAAGAASLSRELRAAMDDAMRGAAKAADRLDELAARRDRKVSGA